MFSVSLLLQLTCNLTILSGDCTRFFRRYIISALFLITECHRYHLPFHLRVKRITQTITNKVKCKYSQQDQQTCRNPYEQIICHNIRVINCIDNTSPGSCRILDTKPKEAKGCLCQNDITKSHCCKYDKLRYYVRNQVLEDPAAYSDTGRFCCHHEFLFT